MNKLPEPHLSRWQPLRCGITNIYKYDEEEFHFEKGRLLLRGNNGTGKSRVLALTLPFLLDGEVSPHRIEPDGDPAKRIEWNLLMGKYSDRIGYTWIEFGYLDNQGKAKFLTLGCGLKAVEGKGLASKWLFTSRQRVGQDLHLMNPARQPLTRDRLREQLGESGQIFESASHYRAAVDDALFKLGEHRYNALINLLIQLRKPQLSRELNEEKLSAALSEALAPMTANLLSDVAESFRGLEADRIELESYVISAKAVDEFLKDYVGYCKVAARRRSTQVRTAHSDVTHTKDQLREAKSTLERVKSEKEQKGEALKNLQNSLSAFQTEERTLELSPVMQHAREFENAQKNAEQLKKDETRQSSVTSDLQNKLQHRQAESEALQKEALQGQEEYTAGQSIARQTAAACDLENAFVELTGPGLTVEAKSKLEQDLEKMLNSIRHLEKLNAELETLNFKKMNAVQAEAEMKAQHLRSSELEKQASLSLHAGVESYLKKVELWASSMKELRIPVERLESALLKFEEWVIDQEMTGDSPLFSLFKEVERFAQDRLVLVKVELWHSLEQKERERKELETQFQELKNTKAALPEIAYYRKNLGRTQRPGAPFWRVVDFRPELPTKERAFLEAALEASGVLDAWITPEGQLFNPETQDLQFDLSRLSNTSCLPGSLNQLSAALIPSIDPEDTQARLLSEIRITRILENIGLGSLGEFSLEVATDGSWRNGPLKGSWTKVQAQYIGQSTREQEKRRRLTEIENLLTLSSEGIRKIKENLLIIQSRIQVLQSEFQSRPFDAELRNLLMEVITERKQGAALLSQLAEAQKRVIAAMQAWEKSRAKRDQDAHDLGLLGWVDELERLKEACHEYRRALWRLWSLREKSLQTKQAALKAKLSVEEGRKEFQEAKGWLEELQQGLNAARTQLRVLENLLADSDAKSILERLGLVRGVIEKTRTEIKGNEVGLNSLSEQMGGAGRSVELLSQVLQTHQQTRDEVLGFFKNFISMGLLGVALGEFKEHQMESDWSDWSDWSNWSMSRGVEIARKTESLLSTVNIEDSVWNRRQKQVYDSIQKLKSDLLALSYDAHVLSEGDLLAVTVPMQGKLVSMNQVAAHFHDEVIQRRKILDAREREVLENHLIDEVSAQLHDLLRSAETWVHEVNQELCDRPMSTGMKLRFSWRLLDEAPEGLSEVRKLLMRASGTWSLEDRTVISKFLQNQISGERMKNEKGSWLEHLTCALDYRKWHQFSVERQQEDRWVRLTRRTHGTGSGGEKAIALTLPQFAAAAAHYRSADPKAPRLVLLDEAFVGVDKDMRSKSMSLLQVFDLDLVMTSEQEWGCYPTVPGLAIYQLSTLAKVDAVLTSRWIWNGKQKIQDESQKKWLN